MEKFDPKCIYIKTWIPELKGVSSEDIHAWETMGAKYAKIDYPKHIIKHAEAKERIIEMYKESFNKREGMPMYPGGEGGSDEEGGKPKK